MTLRRVHLRICGLVQGVSYRANAQHAARQLGVMGWVRNLPSGDVEAVAEAAPEVLERFVTWCRRGPAGARVDAVEVVEVPASAGPAFTTFEVRR